MKLILAFAVALLAASSTQAQVLTRLATGCTSAFFIDEDCDGYGPGVRANGRYGITGFDFVGVGDKPDADDTDATLNTPASVLAKYDANANGKLDTSELKTFLSARRGYNVVNVFYVSPTGSNAKGVKNDPTKPFASFIDGVQKTMAPGDAMVFMEGVYPEPSVGTGSPIMTSGVAGKPTVFMSMPGARVDFTTVSGNGFSTAGIGSAPGTAWAIVDGFTVSHPVRSGWGLGGGWSCSGAQNVIIRNIETARYAYTSCIDGHKNLTVERVIFHHQREHGFYMGANYRASTGIVVQNSIFYANGWDPDDGDLGGGYGGFQYNGRCTGCTMRRNISHSNSAWGLSLIEGYADSTIQQNLIFNNGSFGIILQIYDGSCPALGTGDSGTCPYRTNNNTFLNNTIVLGTHRADGLYGSGMYPEPFAAIGIARNTSMRCIENGVPVAQAKCSMEQKFINNVFVTSGGPVWRFDQQAALGDKWFENSTFTGNVVYKTGGGPFATKESAPLTFAQFSTVTGGSTVLADPQFVHAVASDYATPGRYDLHTKTGSPAANAGVYAGVTPPRGDAEDPSQRSTLPISMPMPLILNGALVSKSNEKIASLPSRSGMIARICPAVAATRLIFIVGKSPRKRLYILARSAAGRLARASGDISSSCVFRNFASSPVLKASMYALTCFA